MVGRIAGWMRGQCTRYTRPHVPGVGVYESEVSYASSNVCDLWRKMKQRLVLEDKVRRLQRKAWLMRGQEVRRH